MSVLYNAFYMAGEKPHDLSRRGMFSAEIDNTFFELEEVFNRSLSSHALIADYEEFSSPYTNKAGHKGYFYCLNLYPNMESTIAQSLQKNFKRKGDLKKIFASLYDAADIKSPSLIIHAPEKGRFKVYHAPLPVTEDFSDGKNDKFKLKEIDSITSGDRRKLSEVIYQWLSKNFSNADLEVLTKVFQEELQSAQSDLQLSVRTREHIDGTNKARTLMRNI